MADFYRKDIARNIINVTCMPAAGENFPGYDFSYSVYSTLRVTKLLKEGGSDIFYRYRFEFDKKANTLTVTDTEKGTVKSKATIMNVPELVEHMERYYFTVCGTKNKEKAE